MNDAPRRARRPSGRIATVLALLAAGVLAACGSAPPARYHTLLPAAAAPGAGATAALAWTVSGVGVPAQVDQPQWVVRLPDDSLRLLEQERWVAPLADELQGAFNDALARRLGPPGLSRPASGRSWRVRIDVQRFDSAPSRHAALVVDWTASTASGGAGPADLRCRDAVVRPVSADPTAIAAAHRQAVVDIASRIAVALVALDAGTAARCDSSS